MSAAKSLSNLQLELVKMFKYELPEQQLSEIKDLLSNYFANRASDEMDKLWDEKGWTNETMEEWGKEHMRTKYE